MNDYPSNMTLRPIQAWPVTPTETRRHSRFESPLSSTLDLLDRELFQLGPNRSRAESVLQVALRESDFRRSDGMPKYNAKPAHPGVILSIESVRGPLSFPCDTFLDWRDNLRAIALTLEALRKVDRYGVTQTGEQYTGFQQLTAAPDAPALSVVDAEQILRDYASSASSDTDGDRTNLGTLAQAYRRAVTVTHPDRGGPRAYFDEVQAAHAVLKKAGLL